MKYPNLIVILSGLLATLATSNTLCGKYVVAIAPVSHPAELIIESTEPADPASPNAAPEAEADPWAIEDLEAEVDESPETSDSSEPPETDAEPDGDGTLPNFEAWQTELRDAEALTVQRLFAQVLESDKSGLITAAIKVPPGIGGESEIRNAADVWLEVEVVTSDLTEIVFEVQAHTSLNRKVFGKKKYRFEIEPELMKTSKGGFREVLGPFVSEIVSDLYASLRKLRTQHHPDGVADLRFAVSLAPDVFPPDQYLKNWDRPGKKMSVRRVPPENDPYFQAARETRQGVLAMYDQFDEKVVEGPRHEVYLAFVKWREETVEIADRVDDLKVAIGAKKRAAGFKAVAPVLVGLGAHLALANNSNTYSKNKETYLAGLAIGSAAWFAKIFEVGPNGITFDEQALENSNDPMTRSLAKTISEIRTLKVEAQEEGKMLDEISEAFAKLTGSTTIEYRGRSYDLAGTVAEKFAQMQEIIAEDFSGQAGA